eukprot:CAMPEP_0171217340 /NCGR_PEP_ID=MMETSP0790-20130122/32636_1 /TAXON_ID=2925 /ORGANISM="Alexandrium catenella, Strain OF101" /LENGTH=178 /DNA_ID=CAMNT_0011683129 /DNA_START=61 /DNA_END=594 /DNA_ORIENTATION=-
MAKVAKVAGHAANSGRKPESAGAAAKPPTSGGLQYLDRIRHQVFAGYARLSERVEERKKEEAEAAVEAAQIVPVPIRDEPANIVPLPRTKRKASKAEEEKQAELERQTREALEELARQDQAKKRALEAKKAKEADVRMRETRARVVRELRAQLLEEEMEEGAKATAASPAEPVPAKVP